MIIQRAGFQRLMEWKNTNNHKPLLVRGARQVGKTTLVKDFAREFDNYIELNLERKADKALFEIDDAVKILNAIFFEKGIKPNKGSVLLFIDEIQEEPIAIKQLRYFYEENPSIYIIAAGSLLEFALDKVPSFPVGRIDYLYLYPVNFEEYLGAAKNELAVEVLNEVPVPDYAHKSLMDSFNEYAMIGGMPEILSKYLEDKNLVNLTKLYSKLWQSYKDDIEKYSKSDVAKKVIRHIMTTAPYQLSRIKYVGFGKSNYKSREVGEALLSLDLAKVIQIIYASTDTELPIMSDLRKRPRLQFIDTGMLSQILLLQGEMLRLSDFSSLYRGEIIQHIIGQELISIHQDIPYKPNFWVREKKGSSSEVDLIYRVRNIVIPIEIKSGKVGTLRSLHQFVEAAPHPYAVRIYGGEFMVEKAVTPAGTPYLLMNMPYYLGTKIPEYLEYFVENYSL